MAQCGCWSTEFKLMENPITICLSVMISIHETHWHYSDISVMHEQLKIPISIFYLFTFIYHQFSVSKYLFFKSRIIEVFSLKYQFFSLNTGQSLSDFFKSRSYFLEIYYLKLLIISRIILLLRKMF